MAHKVEAATISSIIDQKEENLSSESQIKQEISITTDYTLHQDWRRFQLTGIEGTNFSFLVLKLKSQQLIWHNRRQARV